MNKFIIDILSMDNSGEQASSLVEQNGKKQRKKYKLTINQFQMVNQTVFNQSYAKITNLQTKASWETPNFYFKMFEAWSAEVDGTNLHLDFFMKLRNKSTKVSQVKLHEGADTVYLQLLTNPNNKFCSMRYELWQIFDTQKKQTKNRFANSNIFDSFQMGFDQISRVQQRPLKQNLLKIPNPDERVGFHADNSVLSQVKFTQEASFMEQKAKSYRQQPVMQVPMQRDKLNEEDQRQMFINNLDDSISVLQSILDILPEVKNVNEAANEKTKQNDKKLEEINEESDEQFLTTAEKWYSQKFSKKNYKIKKKGNMGRIIDPTNNSLPSKKIIKIIHHNPSFLEKEEVVRQMTEMSVEDDLKLKSIDFSLTVDGSLQKMYTLSRDDQDTSSLWYTAISLPSQGTIMVQCATEEGQLNGCLGTQQIKKGQCPLFDKQGNLNGNFKFKCKSISNYVVQTHQLIADSKEQSIEFEIISGRQKDYSENNLKPIQGIRPQEQQEQIKVDPKHLKEEAYRMEKKVENPEIMKKQQRKVELLCQEQNLNTDEDNQKVYFITRQQIKSLAATYEAEREKKQKEENQRMLEAMRLQDQQNEKLKIQNKRKQRLQSDNQENKVQKQVSIVPLTSLQTGSNSKEGQLANVSIKGDTTQNENMRKSRSVMKSRMKKYYSQNQQQQLSSPTVKDTKASATLNLQTINTQTLHQAQQISRDSPMANYNDNNIADQNERLVGIDEMHIWINPQQNGKSVKQAEIERYNSSYNQPRRQLYRSFHDSLNNSQIQFERFSNFSVNAKKTKKINIKIQSMILNFVKPNYNKKIMKMSIGNEAYYTQTSKDLFFVTWQGRGYFFLGADQYGVLYLHLIEESNEEQIITGVCKVHIACLNTSLTNVVQQHKEFLRNENQEEVAGLKLMYRIIDKNKLGPHVEKYGELESSQTIKFLNNSPVNIPRDKSLKAKKNNKHLYTQRTTNQISSRITDSNTIRASSHRRSSINQGMLSYLKIKSPASKRKYTGGNNLFMKATRFPQENVSRQKKYEPGPGSYETPSSFDRHATPL